MPGKSSAGSSRRGVKKSMHISNQGRGSSNILKSALLIGKQVRMESNTPSPILDASDMSEEPIRPESHTASVAPQLSNVTKVPVGMEFKTMSEVPHLLAVKGKPALRKASNVSKVAETSKPTKGKQSSEKFHDSQVCPDPEKTPILPQIPTVVNQRTPSGKNLIKSMMKAAAASVTSMISKVSSNAFNSHQHSSSSFEISGSDQCSRLGDEADDEFEESGHTVTVNRHKVRIKHRSPRGIESDSSDEEDAKTQQGAFKGLSPRQYLPHNFKQNVFTDANRIVRNVLSPESLLTCEPDSSKMSLFNGQSYFETQSTSILRPLRSSANSDESDNSMRTVVQNSRHFDCTENALGLYHKAPDNMQKYQMHTLNVRSPESRQEQGLQTSTGKLYLKSENCSSKEVKQICHEQSKECRIVSACEQHNILSQNTQKEHIQQCRILSAFEQHNILLKNTLEELIQSKGVILPKRQLTYFVKAYDFETDTREEKLLLVSSTKTADGKRIETSETEVRDGTLNKRFQEFPQHEENPDDKKEDNTCLLLLRPHGPERGKEDTTDKEQTCYCSDDVLKQKNHIDQSFISKYENPPKHALTHRVKFNGKDIICPISTSLQAWSMKSRNKTLPPKRKTRTKSIMKKRLAKIEHNPDIVSINTKKEKRKNNQQAECNVSSICSFDQRQNEQSNSFPINLMESKYMTMKHFEDSTNAHHMCSFHRKVTGVKLPSKSVKDELSENEMCYLYSINLDRNGKNVMNRISLIEQDNSTKWAPANMFHRVTGSRPLLKPLTCSSSLEEPEMSYKDQAICAECDQFYDSLSEIDSSENEVDPNHVLPPFYYSNLKRYKIGSLSNGMSKLKNIFPPSDANCFNIMPTKMTLCATQRKQAGNRFSSDHQSMKCTANKQSNSREVIDWNVSDGRYTSEQINVFKEEKRNPLEGKYNCRSKDCFDLETCYHTSALSSSHYDSTSAMSNIGVEESNVRKTENHYKQYERKPQYYSQDQCKEMPYDESTLLAHIRKGAFHPICNRAQKGNRLSEKSCRKLPPVSLQNKVCDSKLFLTNYSCLPAGDTCLKIQSLADKCMVSMHNRGQIKREFAFGTHFKPNKMHNKKQTYKNLSEEDPLQSTLMEIKTQGEHEELIQWEKEVLDDGVTSYKIAIEPSISRKTISDTDRALSDANIEDSLDEDSQKEKETLDSVRTLAHATVESNVHEYEDYQKKMLDTDISLSQAALENNALEHEETENSHVDREQSADEGPNSLESVHGAKVHSSYSQIMDKPAAADAVNTALEEGFKGDVSTHILSTTEDGTIEDAAFQLKVKSEKCNPLDSLSSHSAKMFKGNDSGQYILKQRIVKKQLADKMNITKPGDSSLDTNLYAHNERHRTYKNIAATTLEYLQTKSSVTSRAVQCSDKQVKNFKVEAGKKASRWKIDKSQMFSKSMFTSSNFSPKVIQSWQQSTCRVRKFVHQDPRSVLSTSNIHGSMCVQKLFIQKVPISMLKRKTESSHVVSKTRNEEVLSIPDDKYTSSTSLRTLNLKCDESNLHRKASGADDGMTRSDISMTAAIEVQSCPNQSNYIDIHKSSSSHLHKTTNGHEASSSPNDASKYGNARTSDAQCSVSVNDPFNDDDLFAEFEEFPDFQSFFED